MAIQSGPNEGLRELALFAGAGGGILGGKLLGWRTVCAVERDAYAAQVLAQRQNDGHLEPFPIWSDVTSFDGKPWRGIVDVVSGGFPCQDISVAGKGAGITGARSGLWKEFGRIIGEVRPRYAFIENSPALVTRGLGTVLCDLAAMGFDAEWGVISAADCGAVHRRERIWIMAHSRLSGICERGQRSNACQESKRQGSVEPNGVSDCSIKERAHLADATPADGERQRPIAGWQSYRPTNGGEVVFHTTSKRLPGSWQHQQRCGCATDREGQANFIESIGRPEQWCIEPALGRVANGVAYRVDRLAAIGNGQVPLCAATAWEVLTA